MGETVLSFHIHSGTDTCDGCEPGQVMAHLSKHRREEKTGEQLSSGFARDAAGRFGVVAELCRPSCAGPAPSKEDKEALRQKELKQMKAKYGLQVGVASSGRDPSALCAANHALCCSVCAEQRVRGRQNAEELQVQRPSRVPAADGGQRGRFPARRRPRLRPSVSVTVCAIRPKGET